MFLLLLFGFACMLALGASNQQVVHLNVLIKEFDWPLAIVMGLFFLIGFCLAAVAAFGTLLGQKLRYLRLHRQLTKLQKQIDIHTIDSGNKP